MATTRLTPAREHAPRVVVVGAGPAGARCAQTLLAAGIEPIVIDENRRDGGQIYRRQPEGFTRDYKTLYGTEAAKAKALHQAFDALKPHIDYRANTAVWNLAGGRLFCISEGVQSEVEYDALILCTGATDRLMAVKGWHFPGNYSLGGSQIALKAQAVSIGHRVVFMGSGPLLYLVASQYVKAGAQVAAVLDTSPLLKRVMALPNLLARPGLLFTGLSLTSQLLKAKVPVHWGIQPLEVTGDSRSGVSGVRYQQNDKTLSVDCDAVALGYHLRPETQLADLAGCELHFDDVSGQWVLNIDQDGRTTAHGVYAAGDGARIRGADAAESAGRLVAMAVLADLGREVDSSAQHSERVTLKVMERFRVGLSQAFPWPAGQAKALPDEAIVCRCEMITAGELRAVVREKGAREVNRAKAFSRVGMGRCQGRYCAQAGAEIIAAESAVPVQEVGRQRGQAPVKPLSMIPVEVLS